MFDKLFLYIIPIKTALGGIFYYQRSAKQTDLM
ncbi:hypothetical protein H650_02275 [Enterobacter sp. R4-368]|nr:hypothetical protein H650_02275 [Enterobacter sp. R4-368]